MNIFHWELNQEFILLVEGSSMKNSASFTAFQDPASLKRPRNGLTFASPVSKTRTFIATANGCILSIPNQVSPTCRSNSTWIIAAFFLAWTVWWVEGAKICNWCLHFSLSKSKFFLINRQFDSLHPTISQQCFFGRSTCAKIPSVFLSHRLPGRLKMPESANSVDVPSYLIAFSQNLIAEFLPSRSLWKV